ncbi:hypothetical protein [Methylobacterium brachythecii]|uniref:Uncharacterized protein n=1 Tax=Methylobacterium brachythecii TaxID=1176177 RepID=A0A7W6AIU7_9HYPH|nr:hypothetical protein [Methylobacterium brachythecii]MBB3902205.1 hypothetical protein [Methylobacterium brachythecii]GLS42050.1 hypothetical protein GCM10007884_00350 [Methylobacterium brachythecii]
MATDSSPLSHASRRDGPIALAIAAVVVATVVIGALAPGVPHKPAPAAAVFPDSDPTCAEWSDGCRACMRTPDGPVCSTPGIACTAGQQECLRRATP